MMSDQITPNGCTTIFPALRFDAAGFVQCDDTGKVPLAILNAVRKRHNLSPRSPRGQRLAMAAIDDMFERFPGIREKLTPRTALVYSSLLGPQGMISKFQDDLLDFPEDQAMAGSFASSVHNAPSGGISVAYGLTGPYFSVTGTTDLFDESLRLALALLRGNFCDSVLLSAGEESTVLADALRKVRPELPMESAVALFITPGDPGIAYEKTGLDYMPFVKQLLGEVQ